jgi:hypothetical protein
MVQVQSLSDSIEGEILDESTDIGCFGDSTDLIAAPSIVKYKSDFPR